MRPGRAGWAGPPDGSHQDLTRAGAGWDQGSDEAKVTNRQKRGRMTALTGRITTSRSDPYRSLNPGSHIRRGVNVYGASPA